MTIELSIVIPAFNEQNRIGFTLDRLRQYCNRFSSHELIIVDDGSTDHTTEVVRQHSVDWRQLQLISLTSNKGKGWATKTGVLAASGEWILTMDADLPISIQQIDKLNQYRKLAQVVIASRYQPGALSLVPIPLTRKIMGHAFHFLVKTVVLDDFHDTQCGIKFFEANAAQDLFSRLTINRFAFDVELLYLAKKRGYVVKEVSVEWSNDTRSTIQLFRDPARMILDLFKIRWRHRHLGK